VGLADNQELAHGARAAQGHGAVGLMQNRRPPTTRSQTQTRARPTTT